MLESLFAGLQACNFVKKRHQHRCFPVNITKFLRTPILKDICQRLLLKGINSNCVKIKQNLVNNVKLVHLSPHDVILCCQNAYHHKFIAQNQILFVIKFFVYKWDKVFKNGPCEICRRNF